MGHRVLAEAPEENFADMQVGDIMRRTRLHYDQSLEDIERALRIRASQIEAIENGWIERLPGRVYTIGFVRTYAEYLGLDGGKVVDLFKAQYMDAQPKTAEMSFPVAASDTKTPSWWVLIGSGVLAVAILVWWGMASLSDRSEVTDIPQVPLELTERFESSQPEMLDTSAPPAFVQTQAPKGIVLNIVSNTWVQIRNAEGVTILSDVLKAGDQYFVPDNPGMTMSLGNAGGVEILLDGRALKPLGKDGDIREAIPLDTSYLKTLEFKDIGISTGDENIASPVAAEAPVARSAAPEPSAKPVSSDPAPVAETVSPEDQE